MDLAERIDAKSQTHFAPRRVSPSLHGIPETMLWALHERATEARRPGGVLHDPWCVQIYEAIDYDFPGRFGAPRRLAAVRAARIDHALRRWLARHPAGMIVSLGEGLETQALRVDNGSMRWLSIDLPEAIRVREIFLPPTERFRHLGMSAFDLRWMDHVETSSGLFIVAQGLFMYFKEDAVRRLVCTIASRFRSAELIFDVVPCWVSGTIGHSLTRAYTSPTMPWGLDGREIRRTFRSWCPTLQTLQHWRLKEPDRRPEIAERILDVLHPGRTRTPSIVQLRL